MRGATKNLLVILTISLLLGEVFARIFFRSPYASLKPRPQVLHYQSDINLGWKNNSGNYKIDFSDSGKSRTIHVEIGKKGERLSYGNTKLDSKADLLFVGDSWTFGEAVQAEESFPGIVAKALPSKKVINLGVGGYSTYQTLLQLETLEWEKIRVGRVFYGLLSYHEERNTASNGWLRSLSRSGQGRAGRLPYVSLAANDRVKRESPKPIPFPHDFCKISSLVCAAKHSLWRLEDYLATGSKRVATERLILEIEDLVSSHGSELTVILLDPESFRYESYLKGNHIDFLKVEGKFGRLSYDAHPDFTFHDLAAHRILEKVSPSVLN